jgi:hypothetical protein
LGQDFIGTQWGLRIVDRRRDNELARLGAIEELLHARRTVPGAPTTEHDSMFEACVFSTGVQ